MGKKLGGTLVIPFLYPSSCVHFLRNYVPRKRLVRMLLTTEPVLAPLHRIGFYTSFPYDVSRLLLAVPIF